MQCKQDRDQNPVRFHRILWAGTDQIITFWALLTPQPPAILNYIHRSNRLLRKGAKESGKKTFFFFFGLRNSGKK